MTTESVTHRPVYMVVGNLDDPHVSSVLEGFPRARSVVLDASNISEVVEEITEDRVVLRGLADDLIVLDGQMTVNGWIRRIAPNGWDDRVVLGTRRAVTLAARLALLAGVMRSAGVSWMTSLDSLTAAENKIVQYRTARRLQIRVPRTLVGPNAEELGSRLGDPFVLKPLGPGAFVDDSGAQRVVHTTSVISGALIEIDLMEAPFIAQEQLQATTHLRIVTAGDRFWVNELSADGVPLDWRTLESAHSSFVVSASHSETGLLAVSLAQELDCFYSSQDWIVETAGTTFIDLNPNGQWLFLPHPCAGEVTDAIAAHLREGPRR